MIAAVALANDLPLYTRNPADLRASTVWSTSSGLTPAIAFAT